MGVYTNELLEFVKNKNNSSKDVENDFIVENVIETYKCPITLVRLVNPMRSKVCNHYYSQDAINQILQRKKTIKCPAFGCGSKLTQKDLILDTEMIEFLRRNPHL